MAKKADEVQIFHVFMVLVGDVEKTAAALDVDPDLIRSLAEKYNWTEKVRRISILSKGGTQGDWERAQNRALNFVQAHQLRRIIDLQLAELADKPVDEVLKITDQRTFETKYSARVLVDLARAMQAVQEMSYNALGDSVKERTAEKTSEDPITQGGLHTAMISALNKSGQIPKPVDTLADEASGVIAALKSADGSPTPLPAT
jgi:hypothetical protein